MMDRRQGELIALRDIWRIINQESMGEMTYEGAFPFFFGVIFLWNFGFWILWILGFIGSGREEEREDCEMGEVLIEE